MRIRRLTVCLLMAIMVNGCSSMNIEEFSNTQPHFVLDEYFLGTTHAWGLFEDRFGNVKRSFKVTINGSQQDGKLILVEDFVYNDGETDQRIWTITQTGKNRYEGQADDIIGKAQGLVAGNALNWKYTMMLPVGGKSYKVKFNDWMFLQSDDVMINKATVSKWGIELGTVLLFFNKQPTNTHF